MWELSKETKLDSKWKEKSIEQYELYEMMLKPLILAISSLVQVSDYLQTKILLLYCSITTGQVPNDAIYHLRGIFLPFCAHFVCVPFKQPWLIRAE